MNENILSSSNNGFYIDDSMKLLCSLFRFCDKIDFSLSSFKCIECIRRLKQNYIIQN